MKRHRLQLKGMQGRFQLRSRMRVPRVSLPFMCQLHVVDAIRRSSEIDTEDLYGKALREVSHGQNALVLADLSTLVAGAMSGEPDGKVLEAAERTYSGLGRLEGGDDAYPNIVEFNRRFLNSKGHTALLNVLVLKAAELDPAEIDAFRGGEALVAAYGPRRTRQHKKLGAKLQRQIKQFDAMDEPGTMEAADRYVKYRYLDNGSMPAYRRRQELEGNARNYSYLRNWFGKFDQALGFPPPPLGRPSDRRGHR